MKITHDIWMRDTAAFGKVRSSELKQIDNALLAYEKALKNSSGSVLAERKSLQNALVMWKSAQSNKNLRWKDSIRNKRKTVEMLDAELGHVIVGAGGLNILRHQSHYQYGYR
jgi:hypothetical protein